MWGFDPGNKMSGVSLFLDEELLWSASVQPHKDMVWDCDELFSDRMYNTKQVVYCEVPQNGTHTSRGGVHWAGGMLLSSLNHKLTKPVPRGNVRKVTPSRWRGWAGLPVRGTDEETMKEISMERVRTQFGITPATDDEAEAILIGYWGSVREGTL